MSDEARLTAIPLTKRSIEVDFGDGPVEMDYYSVADVQALVASHAQAVEGLQAELADPQRMAACIPVIEANERLRAALTAKDQQLGQALCNQNLNAAAAVIRDGELREAETALAEARQQIAALRKSESVYE